MSENETTEKAALEISNLSHSFKNHKALNGVNFTVGQKSIHGFVGPNGAPSYRVLAILPEGFEKIWTSVKDESPEKPGWYWVKCNDGEEFKAKMLI